MNSRTLSTLFASAILLAACETNRQQTASVATTDAPATELPATIAEAKPAPEPTPAPRRGHGPPIDGIPNVIITDYTRTPGSVAASDAQSQGRQIYRYTDAMSLQTYVDWMGEAPYSYDPANGTVSRGDVWRVKNGDPTAAAIWVTTETAPQFDTERYSRIDDSSFRLATADPLSTFSIDVDTASYANVRRFLDEGRLPPADAVRIEEMVNYFHYDYPQPTGADPFSVNLETSECPWEPRHRLVRVGLGGREIARSERPPCNLVFLVDVSGSMSARNKLPLVKQSLKRLAEELGPRDTIGIVVYAGASGLVLPPVSGSDTGAISAALDRLQSGGSTNGGAGIELAYATAAEHMIEGGANRVILCTDGDFNVGTTNTGALTDLVAEKAKSGVFLTVLGFGSGNLNDAMMEDISNRGNGNYAYIDSEREAEKVLVEQAGGTLVTIAKDVKIQVEFNPERVRAWRLVGYRNRLMQHHEFNDDTKDAGEIGAGHQVTALYEIVPPSVDMGAAAPDVDALKYQRAPETTGSGELLTVKLRYKEPDGDVSRLVTRTVTDSDSTLENCSDDFVFAASVAGLGLLLRQSEDAGLLTPDTLRRLASSAKGADPKSRRAEFVALIDRYAEVRSGLAMK